MFIDLLKAEAGRLLVACGDCFQFLLSDDGMYIVESIRRAHLRHHHHQLGAERRIPQHHLRGRPSQQRILGRQTRPTIMNIVESIRRTLLGQLHHLLGAVRAIHQHNLRGRRSPDGIVGRQSLHNIRIAG